MKGKERSPVKKRSRALDEIRDRGGNHPTSKKMGALSVSGGNNNGNTSAKSEGGSTRRSLLGEKRDGARDFDGHASGGRSGSNHSYASPAASSSSKNHSASLALETAAAAAAVGARTNSRAGGGGGGAGAGAGASRGPRSRATRLSDEEIEDGLFHEFKKFGDVSVKISRISDERVAFVNFRRPEDARAAKHARGRLVLYDRPLKIEAVYINRRRSRSPVEKDPYAAVAGHRHLHAQRPLSPTGLGYRDYRLQQLALGRLPPPPPPPLPRDLEREREYAFYEARARPAYIAERNAAAAAAAFREEEFISPEDDQRANRTLFLGNLDITVAESDLRRAFDRFGVITEVDIKRPTRGQSSTYGFLKFENLDMAHRAKLSMSGKVVGRNPIKIGYGKATPTTRLWVGGLGPWVPLAALAREFDRFGTIRTIDYRKGDAWAYVQYESLDAAQAAGAHMRGFPLGGPERRLRVDFADAEHRYQQPSFLPPLPLARYEGAADALRARERSPPPPPPPLHFRERELYPGGAAEWAGPVRERLEHLERVERERARPPPPPPPPLGPRRLVPGARDAGPRRPARPEQQAPRASPAAGGGPRPDPRTLARRRGRRRRRPPGPPETLPPLLAPRPLARGQQQPRRRAIQRRGAPPPLPALQRPDRPSPARGGADHHAGPPPDKRLKAESGGGASAGGGGGGGGAGVPERKRKAGDAGKGPAKKERPSDPPAPAPPSSKGPHQGASKQDGPGAGGAGSKLGLAWQGTLLLKNSNFPSRMHLLEGDLGVATALLLDGSTGGQVAQLKITQRLRLDQPKLDEVTRRMKVAGPGGYSVLLAVPGGQDEGPGASSTQRPLRNLVSYLKQKQAAGVISLPQFLDSSAKALAKSEEDYLVMIIVRGAS
ncbi:hypothetical protein AAFF_G00324640 [Aldrovandia affinis]|uniref:RNA-binding protein 15 n=1 Tax=Aldrovandia affinis TaxID=143900 RepID=A0AAD7R6H7_9TELE|nr:hypothetical protein AAFF_G00324640 [Aldrovandia affinis]